MGPTLKPMPVDVAAPPLEATSLLARYAALRSAGASTYHNTYLPLARTIEQHVLPRLRAARVPADSPGLSAASSAVTELVDLALGTDPAAVHHLVGEALGHQTYEEVCLDLLAPAARRLGEMWAEDYCTFVDVSVALLRLQEALHIEPPDGPAHTAPALLRRKLLVTAMPGDQHIFGAAMVASLFRRAGWDVALPLGATPAELFDLLGRERFDVFALSIGNTRLLAPAAQLIRHARAASRQPGLRVMVGGPAALEEPVGIAAIGADLISTDGARATWQAENLLGARMSV